MPYTSSSASQQMMNRLRDLLGGGGKDNTQTALDHLLGASANVDKSLAGAMPQPAGNGINLDGSNILANLLNPPSPFSGVPAQGQQAGQPQQTQDFLEQFLKSMAGNIGGNSGGLNQKDYEQALADSANQIKKAYGAEIGAVNASSANAQHQTKRSKKQIRAMYNALAKQYNKSAGQEVAQGKQIANALQGVANQASGNVKATSDQLLSDQAALAQNLGVQSAVPDVAAAQKLAVAKDVGNIQQEGARNAGAQLSNSGTQQRFLVRGGRNSLLEGTNRRADLVQQLQAFLQQNMGKIADIKGQEGQALAASNASTAKAFADAGSKQQDSSWQRQKDLAGLLLSLRGQNQKGSSAASSLVPKSDQFAGQLLSTTSDPQGIGSVIQQLLTNPQVTQQTFMGGAKGNTPVKMNAGQFAAMTEKALKDAGYSPAEIAAAKQAAIIYYKGIYG